MKRIGSVKQFLQKALRRYLPYWIVLGVSLLLLLLFEWGKANRPLMNTIADVITTPFKQGMAFLWDWFPFSMAEVWIVLAVAGVLAWLIKTFFDLLHKPQKLWIFGQKVLCLCCAAFIGYTSFSYLWGVNYYTDTFQDKSGIHAAASSVEELEAVTRYFARMVNETAPLVQRDEEGHIAESLDSIFEDAARIGEVFEREMPYLPGNCYRPKRVFFSRFMSRINCTGFFFPYTGEANIDIDAPLSLMPSTIVHELAHQRAVASEQEANFIAVKISTESGCPAYVYSGWLLGYIYLNNALYAADYERFERVYGELSDLVRLDLADNSAYWKQFESVVSDIADQITDQRLKNYGQEQGIQSYGAVVDLLVAYYGGRAAE